MKCTSNFSNWIVHILSSFYHYFKYTHILPISNFLISKSRKFIVPIILSYYIKRFKQCQLLLLKMKENRPEKWLSLCISANSPNKTTRQSNQKIGIDIRKKDPIRHIFHYWITDRRWIKRNQYTTTRYKEYFLYISSSSKINRHEWRSAGFIKLGWFVCLKIFLFHLFYFIFCILVKIPGNWNKPNENSLSSKYLLSRILNCWTMKFVALEVSRFWFENDKIQFLFINSSKIELSYES